MKGLVFSVLLATLLAVCQAQPPPVPPPPPKFAETFVAQYEIFRPGQVAFISGSGSWARTVEEGHVMSTLSLKYTTHSVRREHIRFFDNHREYIVQFDDSGRLTNCTSSLIPEEQKLPPAWDWVEEAHYMPYHDRNVTYEAWKLHTRHGSMQVAVKPQEREKPYIFIETDNAGDEEKWYFIMFEAVTPPESIYEIPEQCLPK